MLRNVQIKIILILAILGIIVITGMGMLFSNRLENLNNKVSTAEIQNYSELKKEIEKETEQIKTITLYTIGSFVVISLVTGIFVIKIVAAPIAKLTRNVKDIAEGKTIEIDKLATTNSKSDIDDLVNAFRLMTIELNDKFNEASRQKKQIETILLYMTDGIIAFGLDGDIIHINPAAIRLLKLEEEDNTFDKIFKKLDVDINMEKVIYLENWTSSEQKVKLQERYVNMLFAPYKDENDRPGGVIAVIQDITEHVKLDNMRKEFVADVSHELKTPITSIMGYADTLLEAEYEKEVQQRFLAVISSEARRMARLVNDLLTLSKYDNKQTEAEKSEFDLGELVKQAQEGLNIEIQKKKQDVECFVTANVPMVYADKYGIQRVVINILTNSIKYTPEGGNIKIYVGFVYNDAYIKIIDNGIGIPEEDLTRIFDRFYRVDKARTRQAGGTGLGLSIAKEILDQNNGSIDIKSEVGKGTEVVIRIPTVPSEEKNEEG